MSGVIFGSVTGGVYFKRGAYWKLGAYSLIYGSLFPLFKRQLFRKFMRQSKGSKQFSIF